MAIKLVSSNDNPAENVVRPQFGAGGIVPPTPEQISAASGETVLPSNFADYPKTLGEHRSDKSDQANDWTPRDALIAMLRDIDSGAASPDNLIIVWSVGHTRKDKPGNAAGFLTSNQDGIVAMIGEMERTKHAILADGWTE